MRGNGQTASEEGTGAWRAVPETGGGAYLFYSNFSDNDSPAPFRLERVR